MNRLEIRDKIISNAVKNLQEFGYQSCDKENILTDIVYGEFFASSLKENLGHSELVDSVINDLIKEVSENLKLK
jgi:hypothetical protein